MHPCGKDEYAAALSGNMNFRLNVSEYSASELSEAARKRMKNAIILKILTYTLCSLLLSSRFLRCFKMLALDRFFL